MRMKWQDIDNTEDCGVYTMKHMETYENQDPQQWEPGFSAKHNVSYFFPAVFLLHI